jgi:hypothetical protein
MVWTDLINEITRLQLNSSKVSEENDQSNPIVAIITPEWYYSDSQKIFSDMDIVWDNLERVDLIQNIADSLNEIRLNGARNDGFEAGFCSWYQSYHYTPRTKWGIHVRYNSWLEIATCFNQECPNLVSNPVASVKAAFFYLFMHSIFHYITECATSILEIILQDPTLYPNYLTSIYEKVFNSNNCLEETLANTYLLARSDLCHIERGYLKVMLLKQGPGYNDFLKYVEPKFNDGTRRLISQIRSGKLNPPFDLPIEQIMNISNSMDYPHNHNIPIWLHKRAIPLHDKEDKR